jgi:gamma-glutamylcyclotransferase (GGCT)/AIG2-like uncharacterized protein YtfP
MSESVPYLFVYGSLLPGREPPEVASTMRRLQIVGNGYVRGHLHDVGEYKGVVLDERGDRIDGKIFRLPNDPHVLRVLDEYEEFNPAKVESSLFLRKEWEVATGKNNERLNCWVYVYNLHPASVPAATRVRNGRDRRL